MGNLKERAIHFYETHETRVDLAFFLGGFVFDVLTLSQVDDLFSIVQQIIYLLIMASILGWDLLNQHGVMPPPWRFQKVWDYRSAIVHFLLGSLLSVYSLFFLKSASIFSSLAFVLILMGVMVANEMKRVQSKGFDIKLALYVVCLFSFFSMIIPVLLGFVGWVPFLLSLVATSAALYVAWKILRKRVNDGPWLQKRMVRPSGIVLGLCLVFYLIGWIPPVPLAVEELGVYHQIEKSDGEFRLFHENPWWKIWNEGDQDFKARPGDKIHLFTQVYSPARFDDTVILHWQKFDPSHGWQTTDKIPMRVTGGRAEGYRGNASKANYSPGEWRVSVETTDGREIGRISMYVSLDQEFGPREFKTIVR